VRNKKVHYGVHVRDKVYHLKCLQGGGAHEKLLYATIEEYRKNEPQLESVSIPMSDMNRFMLCKGFAEHFAETIIDK
jgi:hypothetical protein